MAIVSTTATVFFCCEKPVSQLLLPSRSRASPRCSSPLITLNESVAQVQNRSLIHDPVGITGLIGTGLVAAAYFATGADAIAMAAVDFPVLDSLELKEPANALSLPTWAVHVSSVVEWITAMTLVWKYGERKGNESWKGLSWGMVPLLGGALCACTWHFFYNAESLEVLVALQAALTVIGNITMCIAAFRINRSSKIKVSK